jgi:AhpD family alkylhydroperoxidase
MGRRNRDRWLQGGLVILGAGNAAVGLWARVAPHNFYGQFPGDGHHWVSAVGPYDAHLVTDFGSALLALGVVLLAAAVLLDRRLVQIALWAQLVFAVPHLAYHLSSLDRLSPGDNIANLGELGAAVVLPIALLWLLRRPALVSGGANVPPDANARIAPAPARGAFRRLLYLATRKRYGKVMTPARVMAHHPTISVGYIAMELAAERAHDVDERLKNLAMIRAAMLVGCEFCLDIGTAISRRSGISDDQLRELGTYRDSRLLSPLDKLVIEYADHLTRTPVDVPDALFARLREHFDEPQLVELTSAIALENYRTRFNWAFKIGSDGFSDGAYCVPPERTIARTPTTVA